MAYPPVTLIMRDNGDGTSSSFDVSRLTAPGDLAGEDPGARSVTLTWSYMDNGQTGFEIQRSADGVLWSPAGSAGAASRSLHISNLDPGFAYYFRIRVVDSENPARNSAWATPITVTTAEAPPVPSEFVQLAHYAEAEYPLEIFYPRPDNETNVWARHRKNHPDVPYRVPVICAFGAPPWFFELIEGPPGMTIGAFLPQLPSGKFDWEEPGDYGIVKWDNPTADGMPEGGWTVTVRATDQELTVKTITWKLVITTEGILFVDPVNGDNSNAGTIDAPLLNTRGWYLDDPLDTTYSGYQVVYRGGGQHNLYFDPNAGSPGRGSFEKVNKPLVHYGFPGESVEWNAGASQWNLGFISTDRSSAPDFYMGDLRIVGIEDALDKKWVVAFGGASAVGGQGPGSGGCRTTFFDIEVYGLNRSYGTDNAGFYYGHSTESNGSRLYTCGSRLRVSDSISHPSGVVNFVFMHTGNSIQTAFEFCRSENTNMVFPYRCKGAGGKASLTYVSMIDSLARISTSHSNSYDPSLPVGYDEWRYVKISQQQNDDTQYGVIDVNTFNHDPATRDAGPVNFRRATVVSNQAVRYAGSVRVNWPHELQNCILVSDRDAPMYYTGQPDNYPLDANWAVTYKRGAVTVPLDTDLNLTGGGLSILGEFGAEIFGEVST